MHSHGLQSTTLRRALVYSDVRLKRDVQQIATIDNGLKLYRFRYRWSSTEIPGRALSVLVVTRSG